MRYLFRISQLFFAVLALQNMKTTISIPTMNSDHTTSTAQNKNTSLEPEKDLHTTEEKTMHSLKNGILIVVEGIDGSGKSTLVQMLHQKLNAEFPTCVTREPSNTQLGKHIRALIHTKEIPFGDKAEYLLFAADRAQHFDEVIIPQLNNKKLIISDRMADSSVVYQGYGRGLDITMIKTINDWVMQHRQPDLVLYLKTSVETATRRIQERKSALSSFEQEHHDFLQRLVYGFDELFKNRTNSIILDGEQPVQIIAQTAYEQIKAWITTHNLIQSH
jgi:dTMP kinase